jgi:glycosyltransferase involved in cell wall biosynthesis
VTDRGVPAEGGGAADRPLVSCIVPVFNGERFLAEALDSILRQTYRPLEVVVVDDGSTDGTAGVIAAYGPRLRSFYQPNAGEPSARNRGLSAARGAFVAFLDADDLWHAEKLERQMARFHARPGLDGSVTHAQNFWAAELREEQARYQDRRYAQPLPAWTCASLLARRELFEAVGPFDPSLLIGDDNDWFLRARHYGALMELLPDVLVYRRLHGANLSRQRFDEIPDALLRIAKLNLDRRRAQRPAD